MRLKLFAATFVSALVTVWASQVSAETRLRLLSSFDNLNPSVLSADAFIASVAARSGGEYRISRTGPEAVPVGEQLEPTSSGVFDLLFTNGAFHAGRTGVGMVIDSLKTDLELRYSSGLVEYLDNYYQKAHGVKLIALSSGSAYQFLLRDPVAADGGLKGRKIRSLPQYGKLIEALGGVPVTLAPTQMYSSLEKGVIDGVGFPQTAATQYKLQEVIKYIAEPTFGATHIMILMNLRKWNALPPDVQKMFLEEGRTWATLYTRYNFWISNVDVAKLRQAGIKTTSFSPENANKVRTTYNDGLWEAATRVSGDVVRDFRKFVEAKNLLNQ